MTTATIDRQSINIPASEWQPTFAQIVTQKPVALSRNWFELEPMFGEGKETAEMQTELLPEEKIYLLKSLEINGIFASLVMTYTGTIGWVRSEYLTMASHDLTKPARSFREYPTTLTGKRSQRLLKYLLAFANTPYIWGGNTVAGIDCSGFTSFILQNVFHLHLPRNAEQQRRATATRSVQLNYDEVIDAHKPELRPNTLYLIFLVNSAGRAYHTGVLLNGRVWDMDESNDKTGRPDGLVQWSWEDYCLRCLTSKRFESLHVGMPWLEIAQPES